MGGLGGPPYATITIPTYDWDFRTTTSNSYILDKINSQRADFIGNITVNSTDGAYFEGNLNSYINLDPFLLENLWHGNVIAELDKFHLFGFSDNLTNNSSDQEEFLKIRNLDGFIFGRSSLYKDEIENWYF